MQKIALVAAAIGLFVAPALAQNTPAPPPVRVRGVIEKVDGDNLSIKARDGAEMKVAVTATTRIQNLVKKSLADVKGLFKPGAAVFLAGPKGADGTVTATFMYVEKDGIKPPM